MLTITTKFTQEIRSANNEYNTNNFEGKINSLGTMIKRKKWWKRIGIMLLRKRVGSALRKIIEGGVDSDWKTTKKIITSSNRCVATTLLQLEKGEITIFVRL